MSSTEGVPDIEGAPDECPARSRYAANALEMRS